MLFVDGTPMCSRWNSQLTNDPLSRQVIGCMENVSLPPTRLDVVAETFKSFSTVAEECQVDSIIVHCDRVIAKPAKRIQHSESPRYDNIFVCFGPSHIQLAFFWITWLHIWRVWWPHILTDTEDLAAGSLPGLISGKHIFLSSNAKWAYYFMQLTGKRTEYKSTPVFMLFKYLVNPMRNQIRKPTLCTSRFLLKLRFLNSAYFIFLYKNRPSNPLASTTWLNLPRALPFVFYYWLNFYGWRGTLLIRGGLVLNMLS